jgi:tetratricopeptide (TPR) repeat protein
MTLYRPVGLQELALIYDSGMKAFPARLPQQPIFYPVLDLEYARQTASGWNTQNAGFAGYVTEFKVEDDYIGRFEEHAVGGSQYQELWIPADEVEEFNQHIVGHIKVVEAYFGKKFQGFIPEAFGLQGKNAVDQFTLLANSYLYKRMEFYLELKRNHKAVFLNYPFWQTYEFKNPGLKVKIIQAIKEAWLTSFPKTPLPLPPPVQEDTPPLKPTPARARPQRPIDPVQGDPPPVRQKNSPPQLPYPPQEEPSFVRRTPPHAVPDSIDEGETPDESTDPEAWEDPVDADGTFVAQPDPSTSDNPVHEDETSVEPIDIDAEQPANSIQEEPPLVKQRRASARHWVSRRDEISRPQQTRQHVEQGIQLGLRGEYPEAIEELFKAVEADPDDVVARTSLGVAFHFVGEDDRALACYEAALKIDPIYAEAHYFRANILYHYGDVREAVAGYTVAIGLQPELIEAHTEPPPQDRLTDYTRSPAEMRWIAKPAHRILDLNKSIETDPGQASLFKERAAEYFRLRNYAQAIGDYTSSLALQPDDASALHSRGLAYEQLGQQDRAQEDYQRAMSLNAQLSNEYLQRGVTLGRMGNFRQSVVSLTEGIRLAPANPDAYFNRGTSYLQLGDFEAAIADFSMAIQLAPQEEDAYYWRGVSYEETGRQHEATADYRQFLTLSKNPGARAEVEHKLRQWNTDQQEQANDRLALPDHERETNQRKPVNIERELDLHQILVALGKRAIDSVWFGSSVECDGEKAEELYALTNQERPIEGRVLLDLTSGIQQTIKGDFYALDPGADAHWLFIRAWEGSGFYVEIDDPKSGERLKAHFPSVEEVGGVSSPYQGLFIHR